jgi:EmrB/QacA subfamily drug resistance transporter
MFTLDTTVVNPALPTIQRGLGFSPAGLVWVINGYTLVAGGFVIVGGRASDLFGRRRMFVAGTILFALASAASGLAQDPGMLVGARFAQGLGEAIAAPAAVSLIVVLFPDARERARAIYVWGSLSTLGSAFGLTLGGLIVTELGWRWVFLVNLPLAAVTIIGLPRFVGPSSKSPSRSIDLTGALLITGGLTLFVDGFLEAADHAWTSTAVLPPLLVGVALIAAFAASQTRIREPLVPLRFFRSRTRTSANIATIFAAGSFLGIFFSLTLYYQDVLHFSPLQTGFAWVPFSVTVLIGLALSQRILQRLGVRNGLALSYGISAICLLVMSGITTHSDYFTVVLPALAVMGITQGVNFPGLQNSALRGLSGSDAGVGSAVQSSAQSLGGSLGLAVLVSFSLRHAAALRASGIGAAVASTAGDALVLRLSALLTLLGAVAVALLVEHVPLIRDDQPAPVDGAT